MGAAKHILRYMAGTTEFTIVYKNGGFKLSTFWDSNWGNNPYNGKSTSCYIMMFSRAPVSLKSGVQSLTAMSRYILQPGTGKDSVISAYSTQGARKRLSNFSLQYPGDSRELSHFSVQYSRDSRGLSHFSLRYPTDSRALSHFRFQYDRDSRRLVILAFSTLGTREESGIPAVSTVGTQYFKMSRTRESD